MLRTRSWRVLSALLMSCLLAMPALSQSNTSPSNPAVNAAPGADAATTPRTAEPRSDASSAGGLSSGAAQSGSPAHDAVARNDDRSLLIIGMIALAMLVLGAITWAIVGRDHEPRPMTRV